MTMFNESLRAFLKPVVPYLDDETVSEILINGPTDIWVERKGRLQKVDARFTEEGLLGAARNMAQFVGRVLNDERPRLDARLPDGSRIHVVLPPVARKGTSISIRKFFRDRLSMAALRDFGSISTEMSRLVDAAIHLKLNMIVSGGTGSGKTTLLNIISSLIPNEERILVIEDSAELQLNQEHLVSFESRPPDKYGKGEVNMGDLLHSALRLRPDRIVVGEVRGGECFHLLQAMNTGHGGSLSTCHANTPVDTLRRLEALCLMNAVEMPLVAVRAQVASAIHLIVSCERLADGTRKVTHVSEVLPLNERGEYRTQDLFVYTPVARTAEGDVLGYHAPTGVVPGFIGKAWALGFRDLDEAFFDPATYGVPPPPLVHVGQAVTTRWAPSLKHRERGQSDPADYAERFRAFEEQLRAGGARPSAPSPRAPTPAPAAAAPARAEPVSVRPKRPVADEDKTPPPSRNPVVRRAGADEGEITHAPKGPQREAPSVEVSDDLVEAAVAEGTNVRQYPPPPPRKPTGATPGRGSGQAQLRPSGLAPRRPPGAEVTAEEEPARDSQETGPRNVPERFRR